MKMKWVDRIFWMFIAVAIWWTIWRPAWNAGWIRDLWHWLPLGHIIVAVIFFNIGFLAAAILASTGRADKQRGGTNVVKLSQRGLH